MKTLVLAAIVAGIGSCYAQENHSPPIPDQVKILAMERDKLIAELEQTRIALQHCNQTISAQMQLADQEAGQKLQTAQKAQVFEAAKAEAQRNCKGTLDANYACVEAPKDRGTK